MTTLKALLKASSPDMLSKLDGNLRQANRNLRLNSKTPASIQLMFLRNSHQPIISA
jgi:hypothetical protein